ncbi:hypothetical protein L9F63_004908, partial [Diploptera punctata]
MSAFLKNIIKSVIDEVETWYDCENYLKALKAQENNLLDHWINSITREDDGYNVLIHGDLWMNNMMFRYSPDNQVQEV